MMSFHLSSLFSLFSVVAISSSSAVLIDFENDTVGTTPDGWTFDGDSSTVRIAATASSGDYVGGQAIRTDDSGASYAGLAVSSLPVTSIQADFLWGYASTPTLIVYAWDDANGNGFQSSERSIGFGLDNDGQFELSSEGGELPGTTNFAANTWYRLTMTWSDADGFGNRTVTLNAIDLTNSSDLGVVSSAVMTPSDFGVDPSEWDGLAFRMTRGTIDNIEITSEAGAAFTYVDASPANTTLNSDPAGFPGGVPLVAASNYIDDGGSGSGTDGLWTYRTDAPFASFEGASAFESDPGSSPGDREDTEDLITTVSLPVAGTYEIVAVFTTASNRDLAAKIGGSPGANDTFTSSNSFNPNSGEISFDGSYTNGRGSSSGVAYLGAVTTTTDSEEVLIFVNGLTSNPDTSDERTQYEGIGYRAMIVTPPSEPKHRDVFLLAGQSNCDGRGLGSQLTGGLAAYAGPQADVLIHYSNLAYTNSNRSLYQQWVTLQPGFSRAPGYSGALPSTTFGMEIGAGKILSQFYANPAFIKVSQGGTALGDPGEDWYPSTLDENDNFMPGGPLYQELIMATQSALAELEAAGDTYTVHGMFWHQGESDASRTAEYNGLLTTLIESVRRDLGMPNLRFIVGELASTKAQTFRDVQWQVARTTPNANFISSAALVTSDNTHFDAGSMITFGERVGMAFRPDRMVLDFEAPVNAPGVLDRQDEWSAQPQVLVGNTNSEGEYLGGLAVGPSLSSGEYRFNRRNILPLAGARSMQADFNAGDSDASTLVAGWGADAGNDGQFSVGETAIGLGLDSTGVFRVQIGSQSYPATGFPYQTNRWYRLTLTWSGADANGDRTISLFARDLVGGVELNGGSSILSITASSAEFSGQPMSWSGVGCLAADGLIDNISVTPPGFSAWSALFFPALQSGPQDDDDGDGIVNAIEFAFGLDPLAFNSSAELPQPVFDAETATISFEPPATQPGTLYQVEWSNDLSEWNVVSGTRSGALLDFTVPVMEGSVFIRHRVSLSE